MKDREVRGKQFHRVREELLQVEVGLDRVANKSEPMKQQFKANAWHDIREIAMQYYKDATLDTSKKGDHAYEQEPEQFVCVGGDRVEATRDDRDGAAHVDRTGRNMVSIINARAWRPNGQDHLVQRWAGGTVINKLEGEFWKEVEASIACGRATEQRRTERLMNRTTAMETF